MLIISLETICLGFQVEVGWHCIFFWNCDTKANALEQKRSKQLEDLDRVDRCAFFNGRWVKGWLLRGWLLGILKTLGRVVENSGCSWIFMRFSWIFMFFHVFVDGFPWIFMGFHVFHGFSWISIDLSLIFFLVILFVTATEAVGVPPLCGDAAWLLGLLLHSWLGVPKKVLPPKSSSLGNFFRMGWFNHQLVFQKPPKPIEVSAICWVQRMRLFLVRRWGLLLHMRTTPDPGFQSLPGLWTIFRCRNPNRNLHRWLESWVRGRPKSYSFVAHFWCVEHGYIGT